jgi:hypothetical protein
MPLDPKIISDLQQMHRSKIRGVIASFVKIACIVMGFTLHISAAENPPEFLWATVAGGNKECLDMTSDRGGNIYITGTLGFKQHQSLGGHGWSRSGGEVFLVKFSPSGKLLWLQKAGGSGTDAGVAVIVAETGDVYITGYFAGSIAFDRVKLKAAENKDTRQFSPSDMFIAKYSSDGKLLWAKQAGGPALDQSYGIASDKNGNVYVTGYFQGKATFSSTTLESKSHPDGYHEPDPGYGDVFVAKYDASGNIVWVRQAGEGRKNAGYGIAVDGSGNVFITGQFASTERTNTIRFGDIIVKSSSLSAFIAKYNSDGKILWAQPTAGDQYYHRNQIAVDSIGHAFVAGSFDFNDEFADLAHLKKSGRNSDIFLVKYDTDGKILWCKQAGGQAVEFSSLKIDADGNASITGVFNEAASFDQIQIQAKPHDPQISGYESFLARYTAAGDATWVKTIDRNVTLRGLALDKNGAACIAGNFSVSITLDHIKLEPPRDRLKELFDEPVTEMFAAKLQIK